MQGIWIGLAVAVWLPAWAAAREPATPPRVLTTAGEIAAEVTPEADRPADVRFEGPVYYQDWQRTIFVADETGVTFVYSRANPLVRPGDLVRVEGAAHKGLLIGGIRPERVEVIGRGEPPPAAAVEPADLGTGRYHYHRVVIEGVVHGSEPSGDAGLALRLWAGGKLVRIEIEPPVLAEAVVRAERLVDARVRATGLLVGNINDRRQVVDSFIRVQRLADVELLEPPPADAFGIPLTPLAALASGLIDDRRVRLAGTALAPPLAGAVYLRDGGRGLRVGLARGPLSAVGPGDVVEAVGFPAMGLFSVELVDAEIRVTGSGPVPQPRPALAERRSEHDRPDGDLVAVEGQVIEAGEQRVVVRHGELDYGLEWPPGTRLAVPPGSVVRATGICRVAAVEEGSYRVFPRAYTLLLASPADFEVVSSPPWWTPQRTLASLVAGLVALATVAGLGGTWIAVLRRQVGRQLAVIEGQLRAEAVAEERRRIAREFHDSVNQGLAAATLRLDAAAHRLTDERSKSVLDCQRMLLATLQAEAREFIWDLRDPAHADSSLAAALATQLQFFEVPAPALIEFDAPAIGPDPGDGLAAEVRHQIVRIVREAVGNAVQHAGSSRIVVRLRHAPPDGLTIEVADDGTGFDLAARAEADGHFGIRGMRERARRIGGELGIETGPAGTRVILAVGLGGPFAAYAASVNRPPQLRRSS